MKLSLKSLFWDQGDEGISGPEYVLHEESVGLILKATVQQEMTPKHQDPEHH